MPYKMQQHVDIRPVLNRGQAVSEHILQLDTHYRIGGYVDI